LENKEILDSEQSIEEKRVKFERTVNPIGTFRDEVVSVYSQPNHFISKMDFNKAYTYTKYCTRYALQTEEYDNFCKIMKDKTNIKGTRKEINREKVRCWSGIFLNPEYARKIK
jgi:hypothetical protein